MSRKFDRTYQIQKEASRILTDPAVMRQIFKPKPRWMPRFMWKLILSLVLVK
jgi:hypothetical protein